MQLVQTQSHARRRYQETKHKSFVIPRMPRPARSPSKYSDLVTRWQCPICPKICKSKSGRARHIRQKHGTVSSEPILLEMPNQNLSRSPSPEGIQQIICTPELEFPPPVSSTETHSEYETALLGKSSVSPSSPLSNNFQEPDCDSVSSTPSKRRQRLTTVGSTTCHPTMNGE